MRRAESGLLASGLALVGGCGLVLGYDDYAPAGGGTGGATSTSTGTSTTGTGGSGGSTTGTTTGTDTTTTGTTSTTTGTTTTTGSTSSTGGMCDCSADCQSCALNGPCSNAYGNCLTSGECLSLDNCVKACAAPDNVTWLECANACFLAANNAALPVYYEVLDCVCTTCTDCGDPRCQALHCLNGMQDMAEGGVDCSNGIMAGDTCLICPGFACSGATPEACKSGVCNGGTCQ